jgi:alpha-1,3-mannosyltransferase
MSEPHLKVLHVVRQFDPSTGGLETYVSELVSRQMAKFDVSVLTLNRVFGGRTRLPHLEEWGEGTIIRVPFVGFRRLFLPLIGPHILKDFNIIHIHAADQLLDVIAALSLLWPMKMFVTTHGLFFHTKTLANVKKLYLKTITKWSLSHVQTIFAVSSNDAAILKKIGVDSALLRNPIVPLGNFLCEGRDLIYVGRISANKRIDALIKFMAHLVPSEPLIKLHLVGADNDGLWRRLSDDVVRHDLQDHIHYHGYLRTAALIEIARTCGFIVSASRYEGFGLSVIEGMSIGLLPCLHFNPAFTETVELSGCGLLTDFDDPSRAARDFAAWFPKVGPAERKAAAGFAHAQSWDKVVDIYERYYLAD